MSRILLHLTVILAAFASPVVAQPDRAESLFAEARSLAASPETVDRSFAKFDEAAILFRAANNAAKLNEVELEHGRALRTAAIREVKDKRLPRASELMDRGLAKFKMLGNRQEMALLRHDLAFYADEAGFVKEAADIYRLAADDYREAGDRSGEAAVYRNLGLISHEEKNYSDAAAYLLRAINIRQQLGDALSTALLYLDVGDVARSMEKNTDALQSYAASLKLYRDARDRKGEASALYKLGSLQIQMSRYSDATANLESALKLYEAEKDDAGAAVAADMLGSAQLSDAKYVDAERSLKRAIQLYRVLDDINREASTTLNLAIAYQSMSRTDDARAAVERAIERFRNAKNVLGEAYGLLGYADVLAYENKHDEALAKIKAAEKIFQKESNTNADYRTARAYANHYYALSNHGEAIRYGLLALAAAERDKDVHRKASIYVDIANSYSALGQRQRSLEYTSKALAIARQLSSRYMEAVCLSNLGYEHFLLKKYAEAEDHFKKAIVIMNSNGFAREEGYATHNLGLVYSVRRDHTNALASFDRAYALYRRAGDRRPEAFLYDSYGEVYRERAEYAKAVEYFQKAIVLAREVRYSEIEAQALGNMMVLWNRRKQPRLAVLYGKQAVNVYQTIRAGNRTAEKAAQKTFIQSNEKTYRQLANLLIEEGRLGEAQQVLDLLKAEEYFDFVRRDAAEADEHATLALNESERKALEEYSRVSARLTGLGSSFQVLQDKRNRAGGKLDVSEEAEYLRLKKQVEDAGVGLKAFFEKLAAEFSKRVEDGTVITPQSIETLRADLRRVGTDVVLVSTYLLPERYRAIVTTGRTMVDRKVEYSSMNASDGATQKLTGADVNRKIFEFQRALQDPTVDPRKLGKELYDIFVRPLESDLKGAGAKTILWSLDGTLRYIPMAALSPDGKTYLGEQYQNVVVTLGRQSNLFSAPTADEWRAIGAGVSKQHAGFSALPSVPFEIDRVVRDETNTSDATGELGGRPLLDEQFNLENFRNTVPQLTDDDRPFNVLHLATHFSLGANDQDSALLLGDGTRLSLFEIEKDSALDFKDVELLTLSACQTAVSTGDANGREVESLGMLAQKKGAKAVLATLWKVADESTSLFMAEFYRIKKANPKMNKAEAIRLAQKELIDGRIKPMGASAGCRSESFVAGGTNKDAFKCDPNAPFSHPYFWSPFVLIGNWR